MDAKEYVKSVMVLENRDFTAFKERLQVDSTLRFLHAAIGMATETGEVQDQLKKHLIYGKPLDRTNLIEEVGDLLWYVAVAADTLGVDIGYIMDINIAKLRARYGEKFTEAAALNRNVENERTVLDAMTQAGRPALAPSGQGSSDS